MPLISQIETRAMRRGIQHEARESVLAVLEVRFEEVPEASLACEELR